jgi:hypothetical protein
MTVSARPLRAPTLQKEVGNAVVFVHVGDNSPRGFMRHSLEQAAFFAGDSQVIVLTHREHRKAFEGLLKGSRFKSQIQLSFTDDMRRSDLHQQFLRSQHFPEWNGGFWRVTTQRFFYLHEFMHERAAGCVLHLESDVMVYEDLLSLINARRNGQKVLFPLDRSRGIGSVIFLESAAPLELLCQYALDFPAVNDMELLGGFFERFGEQNIVGALPTMPLDLCLGKGFDTRRFARPTEEGWGLFDGAALGQFLGGVDPIHDRRDTRGFKNEMFDLDPSELELCWQVSEHSKTPVTVNTINQPIRNLHIHSKQTERFRFDAYPLAGIDEAEIINGERIMALCDVVLTTPAKMAFHQVLTPGMPVFVDLSQYHQAGTTKIDSKLFELLDKKYKAIFVYGDMVDFFVNHIAPYLEKPHTIVVHNSDHEFSNAQNKIFLNDCITAVFAQNCSSGHPRAYPVPIGLANPMFTHGNLSEFASLTRTYKKSKGVFCEGLSVTHPSRLELIGLLQSYFGLNLNKPKLPWQTYVTELASHQFVFCPRGNGIDTHRYWEALYTGGQPIITGAEASGRLVSRAAVCLNAWADAPAVMGQVMDKYELQPLESCFYLSHYAERIRAH